MSTDGKEEGRKEGRHTHTQARSLHVLLTGLKKKLLTLTKKILRSDLAIAKAGCGTKQWIIGFALF